jgi:hypothetical protein
MNLASLSRPEKEEAVTFLEEWAIKVPAENSKAIPVIAKDEAEARAARRRRTPTTRRLTALRDTRHW